MDILNSSDITFKNLVVEWLKKEYTNKHDCNRKDKDGFCGEWLDINNYEHFCNIYICGYHQFTIKNDFVVYTEKWFLPSTNSSYISAADPECFKKLKIQLDIALHYRANFWKEVIDDEYRMSTEWAYEDGGYPT